MDQSERETTLRRWLKEHRGILLRISRAYAKGPGDDEDLLQDILLALWRALPAFRAESKASTFVYQVALNTALSRHRAAKRRPTAAPLDAGSEPATDGARAAEHRLRWSAVLEALRQVPALDRAVLLMALEGASQQDIADVLGVTPSHAGVKLHRARRRLATLLEN